MASHSQATQQGAPGLMPRGAQTAGGSQTRDGGDGRGAGGAGSEPQLGLVWGHPFDASADIGARLHSGSAVGQNDPAGAPAPDHALAHSARLGLACRPARTRNVAEMTTLFGIQLLGEEFRVLPADDETRYGYVLDAHLPGAAGMALGPVASSKLVLANGHILLYNVPHHDFDLIQVFEDTPDTIVDPVAPETRQFRPPWTAGKVRFTAAFLNAHDKGFGSFHGRNAQAYIWPIIQKADKSPQAQAAAGGDGKWVTKVDIWGYFKEAMAGKTPTQWDELYHADPSLVGPVMHNNATTHGVENMDIMQLLQGPAESPPGADPERWSFWAQWSATWGAATELDANGSSIWRATVAHGTWLFNFLPSAIIRPDSAAAAPIFNTMQPRIRIEGAVPGGNLPLPPRVNLAFHGSLMLHPTLGLMCLRYVRTDPASMMILLADPLMAPNDDDMTRAANDLFEDIMQWTAPPAAPGAPPNAPARDIAKVCLPLAIEIARRGADAAAEWHQVHEERLLHERRQKHEASDEWERRYQEAKAKLAEAKTKINEYEYQEMMRRTGGAGPLALPGPNPPGALAPGLQPQAPPVSRESEESSVGTILYHQDLRALEILKAEKDATVAQRDKIIRAADTRKGTHETRSALIQSLNEDLSLIIQRAEMLISRHQTTALGPKLRDLVGDLTFIQGAVTGLVPEKDGAPEKGTIKDMRALLGKDKTLSTRSEQKGCITTARNILRRNWDATTMGQLAQCISESFASCGNPVLADIANRMFQEMSSPYMDIGRCRAIFVDHFAAMENVLVEPITQAEAQRLSDEMVIDWSPGGVHQAVLKLKELGERVRADMESPLFIKHEFAEGESFILSDPAAEFFRLHILCHPTLQTIVSDPSSERQGPWTLYAFHYEVAKRLANSKGVSGTRHSVMRMHSRQYDLPAPGGAPLGTSEIPVKHRCEFELLCPDNLRPFLVRQMPPIHDRYECENLKQAALNIQFIKPEQGWDRPHIKFVKTLLAYNNARLQNRTHPGWHGPPSGSAGRPGGNGNGQKGGGGKKKGGGNSNPSNANPSSQPSPQQGPPQTGAYNGGGVRSAQNMQGGPPDANLGAVTPFVPQPSQSQLEGRSGWGDEEFYHSNNPPHQIARVESGPPGTWRGTPSLNHFSASTTDARFPPPPQYLPSNQSFYRADGLGLSAVAQPPEEADDDFAAGEEEEEEEMGDDGRVRPHRSHSRRGEPLTDSTSDSEEERRDVRSPVESPTSHPSGEEDDVNRTARIEEDLRRPSSGSISPHHTAPSVTPEDVEDALKDSPRFKHIREQNRKRPRSDDVALAEGDPIEGHGSHDGEEREVEEPRPYAIGVPKAKSTPLSPEGTLADRKRARLLRPAARDIMTEIEAYDKRDSKDPFATPPSDKPYAPRGRNVQPRPSDYAKTPDSPSADYVRSTARRLDRQNSPHKKRDRSPRRGLPEKRTQVRHYNSSSPIICFDCKEFGHKRLECPNGRRKKSASGPSHRRPSPEHTMNMASLAASLVDITESVADMANQFGNPALEAVEALNLWSPSLPTVPVHAAKPIQREPSPLVAGNPQESHVNIEGYQIEALSACGQGTNGKTVTYYKRAVQGIHTPRPENIADFAERANRAVNTGKPNNCPMVLVIVGGVPIKALLDTGASTSCVNDQVRAQTQGLWPWRKLEPAHPVKVANGVSVMIRESANVTIQWSGASRPSFVVHLPGLTDAMLLGMETVNKFGGCEVLPEPGCPNEITGVPRGETPAEKGSLHQLLPEGVKMTITKANDQRRREGQAYEALFTLPGDGIWKAGNRTPQVFALTWSEGMFHPGVQFHRLQELAEEQSQYVSRIQDSRELRYPGRASREIVEPNPIPDDAVQVISTENVTLEPGLGTAIKCRLPLGCTGPWVVQGRPDPFLFFEVNKAVIDGQSGEDQWIFARNESRIPIRIFTGNYIAVARPAEIQEAKGLSEGDIRRITPEDIEDADWGLCEPEKRSPDWKDPNVIIDELDLSALKKDSISEHRIRTILRKHSAVIMCAPGDLGLLRGGLHDIEVNNPAPFLQPARRLNPARLAALKEILDKGVANGTFSPSNSSWASPIVLVRKKDGSLRMCVDYRTLNKRTRPDCYPLPRVDDILDACHNANFFMILDLGTAFWQIGMTAAAAQMAAFITPLGLFQPERMPMGPRNGPATFQRVIDAILRGLQGVKSYVDDILLVAETRDQMYTRFEALLQRLEESGAKLRAEKCVFGATQVEFLGFSISRNGLTPPNKHVDHIKSLPVPRTVKEMQRLLGCINFFRSLIPKFADIAKPLTDSLRGARKGGRITVTREIEDAHAALVSEVTSYPVLQFPDHAKPFFMVCDASDVAVGVALLQDGKDGRHPIGYMSRRFTPTQEKWSVTERELFAVVSGFEHFQVYLLGRTDTVVCTDHMALKALDSVLTLKPKLYRWKLFLEDYRPFHVEFRTGRENKVADYLSRCMAVTGKPAVIPKDLVENVPEIPLLFSAVVKKAQAEDETCIRIMASLAKTTHLTQVDEENRKRYTRIGDLLGVIPGPKQGPSARIRIYLPPTVSRQAVRDAHQTEPWGHVGMERLFRQLSQVVYAKNLGRLIEEETRGCGACAAFRPGNYRYEDTMRNAVDKETPTVLSGWSIDLCSFPHGGKHRVLCIAVEWSTRWAEIIAIGDKTAESVGAALVTHLIPRFGCPSTIITDMGPEFCNNLVQEIFIATGTLHLTTTPYTPNANGIVERRNLEIKNLINTLSRGDPYQWPSWVPIVQLILNSRPPSRGEVSPFELLYNTPPRLPFPTELDEMLRIQENLQRNGYSPPHAIANLRKWAHSQLAFANRNQNERHNAKLKVREWKRGDVVFTRAMGQQDKMCRSATGPYIVWAWNQTASQLFLLDPRAPDKDPAWMAASRCTKVGNIPFGLEMTVADLSRTTLAIHGITKVSVNPPGGGAPIIKTRADERGPRSKPILRVLSVRRQQREQMAWAKSTVDAAPSLLMPSPLQARGNQLTPLAAGHGQPLAHHRYVAAPGNPPPPGLPVQFLPIHLPAPSSQAQTPTGPAGPSGS